MEIAAAKSRAEAFACEVVAVPFFEAERGRKPSLGATAALDAKLGKAISKAVEDGEFAGKEGQLLLLHTYGRIPAQRVLLVGLGKREEFVPDVVRRFTGRAAVFAREDGAGHLALALQDLEEIVEDELAGQLATEGALLALYRFVKYKTEKEERRELEKITLLTSDASERMRNGVEVGRVAAECANLVRDVVNDPANSTTPTKLAELARNCARKHGFRCVVHDRKWIEKEGMGGLLAVSKGSAQPPVFIVLEHAPKGARETVVIVGKGVTFDSGGISLKQAKDMEKMKYDKAGACAVLGAVVAAARLGLPVRVVGLMPCTENLPGGSATKPGDIVKLHSGKTVEVINTDAEGRLILADALSYARRFKPKAVIDLATLTGACTIALGYEAIALLGNDEMLKEKIRRAGERSFERVWELPLWKEYAEYNQSDVADVRNIGGKAGEAGTITAAKFLETASGVKNWCHLDIASTAWNEKAEPYMGLGATGVGVRLLTELLRNW